MKKGLVSIPVLGMVSALMLGACMDSRMTDHDGSMGATSGRHSADMASDSGMMGMHSGGMMNMGDTAMMPQCMKLERHGSMAMVGSMPMMDSAMTIECSKMMGSGSHDHH